MVVPILTYGSETWAITVNNKKQKTEIVEIKFLKSVA
jgi:hypothetical protein